MILGAFVSSSAAGPIAMFAGRKVSIWAAALLCVVSNVVMMCTTSIGALYFARFLIGIANGMLMTFSQLYLQECAPAKYRGLVLGLFQSWTSIGTLVGTVIDNFTVKLDGKNQYIVSLAIIYIVPGILSAGLFFIPESPRWYLGKGRTEKARKALSWLRPYPELVDDEISMIKEAIEAENNLAQGAAIVDMFRNPVDRRRTLLAVGAVSLQAASGAMYMICEQSQPPFSIVYPANQPSLRHLLLRNGQSRLRIRKLLHPGRRRRARHPDQQRRHHEIRPSSGLPHHRHVPVRYHATHRRRRVRQTRRQHLYRQSHRWCQCRVYRRL